MSPGAARCLVQAEPPLAEKHWCKGILLPAAVKLEAGVGCLALAPAPGCPRGPRWVEGRVSLGVGVRRGTKMDALQPQRQNISHLDEVTASSLCVRCVCVEM